MISASGARRMKGSHPADLLSAIVAAATVPERSGAAEFRSSFRRIRPETPPIWSVIPRKHLSFSIRVLPRRQPFKDVEIQKLTKQSADRKRLCFRKVWLAKALSELKNKNPKTNSE
jgi:hypothetical protein